MDKNSPISLSVWSTGSSKNAFGTNGKLSYHCRNHVYYSCMRCAAKAFRLNPVQHNICTSHCRHYDCDVKIPNFTLFEGHNTVIVFFFHWSCIQSSRIHLDENSPIFEKLLKVIGISNCSTVIASFWISRSLHIVG